MKCDVCGTDFQLVGASLVCKNGHTIQNILEDADQEVNTFSGRKKIIRRKISDAAVESSIHRSVAQFIIFRALFLEAVDFFAIADDRVYKYFTILFSLSKSQDSPDRVEICGDEMIGRQTLVALIYMCKRIDQEKRGGIYMFETFRKTMTNFKLNNRLKGVASKQGITHQWLEMLLPDEQIRVITLYNLAARLGNFDSFTSRRVGQGEFSSTGVLIHNIECARSNIRRLFSRNIEIFIKYFMEICSSLSLVPSEEATFYFKKFVYIFDFRRIFIPEVEVCLFLVCFYSERGELGDLEGRILEFLGISQSLLRRMVLLQATFLSRRVSPEQLLMIEYSETVDRFSNLRRAVWVIDQYKSAMKKNKKLLNKEQQ